MFEESNVQSGVDSGPAAGDQQETFDLESYLFGDSEDTGVEEEGDAGPEADDTQVGEPKEEPEQRASTDDLPEDASKAFAKKWAAEKDKLRSEIMEEIQQRSQTTPQQQQQGAPQYRELSESEIQKLADDLEVPPSVAKILHNMQQQQNRVTEQQRQQERAAKDRAEYTAAQAHAAKAKQDNPALPDWDPEKLYKYRVDYYNKYGATLPWSAVYKIMISEAVESGDMARKVEQGTIKKIQTRETNTAAGVKAPAAKKFDINDLPKAEFDKLVEEVKAGKYSKT